jgi:hypothetical protein
MKLANWFERRWREREEKMRCSSTLNIRTMFSAKTDQFSYGLSGMFT